MQTNAIKQLFDKFNTSKFQNTDFQNFPLYFFKFPLYNVQGLSAEMEYCASAASMLAEEFWQIAEGFVEVPVNL